MSDRDSRSASVVRTASGSIERFPLVLVDVLTDAGVEGRAYAQVYFPELLAALDRCIAGLALDLQLAPAALQLVTHAGHSRARLDNCLAQTRGNRPGVGPRVLRQQPVEPGSQAV